MFTKHHQTFSRWKELEQNSGRISCWLLQLMKKWESKEPVGAWRLKCKVMIPYKVKDINGAKRHVEKYHPNLLEKEVSGKKRLNQYHSRLLRKRAKKRPQAILKSWPKDGKFYCAMTYHVSIPSSPCYFKRFLFLWWQNIFCRIAKELSSVSHYVLDKPYEYA